MISEKNRQRVLRNFMKMLGERGWSGIDMIELSKESGIKVSTMRVSYSGKVKLMEDFAAWVDQTVLDSLEAGDIDDKTPPKDRLFDLMMARLDALSPYRDAICVLMKNRASDARLALLLSRLMQRSMLWMLNGAGIEARGIKGAAKVHGLSMVYRKVLQTWMNDEDKGLSATMATLDRELQRGASLLCQLDRVEQTVCNIGRALCGICRKPDVSESSGTVANQT